MGQESHEKMFNIANYWSSLMAQLANNLPAMQETWVLSLDWEECLEKEMDTHSSILLEYSMHRGAWQAI